MMQTCYVLYISFKYLQKFLNHKFPDFEKSSKIDNIVSPCIFIIFFPSFLISNLNLKLRKFYTLN